MSGIFGIINLDGAPASLELLQKMTVSGAVQWPDDRNVWACGSVGFGHALLRTTDEPLTGHQPCSFDGRVWITADARLDGRSELVSAIEAQGASGLSQANDANLILHAYQIWGVDCVDHLIGDFAFAIWDDVSRRLFCARDHFGVKPFYFVKNDRFLTFSSNLDALHMHPEVSERLNDEFIGDFLLFGGNQNQATTVYGEIERLPPAHRLIVESGSMRVGRYWDLPVGGRIRYARNSDYLAHYRQLFEQAVADRLRTDRISVLMSGGTDSAAIGALAAQILRKDRPGADVQAFTVIYRDLLPGDREGYFAGLVADSAGMPINYLSGDDYRFYQRWDSPELYCRQPIDHSTLAAWFDCYLLCAGHSSVVLTGYGGDAAMAGHIGYYAELLKRGRAGKFLWDAGRHAFSHRTLRGLSLRSEFKRMFDRGKVWAPPFPDWIDPEFARNTGLLERHRNYYTPMAVPAQIMHPDAYQSLRVPLWSNLFETDFPVTVPLETRHPFFDLRLIEYLLSIPPVPWCIGKTVHREAMRGILPEPVRTRPKAPLAGNRILARLNHPVTPDKIDAGLSMVGDSYVDRRAYRRALERFQIGELTSFAPITAPVSLNYWLRRRELGIDRIDKIFTELNTTEARSAAR